MKNSRIPLILIAAAVAAVPVLLGACSTPPQTQAPTQASAAPAVHQMQGQNPSQDHLLLPDGRKISGTILYSDNRQTVIESGDYVYIQPKVPGSTVEVYSKENWQKRTQPSPPEIATGPSLGSNWMPRHYASEKVEYEPVTFSDPHAAEDALGKDLLKNLRDIPDMRLFVPAGGRIVIHDEEKRYGWRAYSWPGEGGKVERFHPPGTEAKFVLPFPARTGDYPQTIVFASAAVDLNNAEGASKATSWVPGTAESVVPKELDQAEGMLSRQPFSGGKPAQTRFGNLWCFGLTKGIQQWYLYSLDPSGKHSDALRSSKVGFGEAELVPDYVMDVERSDGVLLGRVWVLPYPPVAADAPAPIPVTLYTGKGDDLAEVAAIPLPPRTTVQGPQAPPASSASILFAAHEVGESSVQNLTIAYGAGRPTAGVTLKARDLKPKTAEELVKIDASATPEDRWPVTYWIQVRRTYAWRTGGGMLPSVAALAVPAHAPKKLRAKIRNPKDAPHALSLKFVGPKVPPAPAATGMAPAAGVASGLGPAFMADALGREAGTISNIVNSAATGGPGPSGGDAGGNVTSVTNVYVTPPSQIPAGALGGGSGGAVPPPAGVYLNSGTAGTAMFAPGGYGPGGYAFRPAGSMDSAGNYYNTQGQQTFNNQNAVNQYYSQTGTGNGGMGSSMGVTIPTGAAPGTPGITVPVRRR